MRLTEAVKETKKVAAKMPKQYTVYQRLTELLEEAGELANAIQTTEGFKPVSRRKSDLVNSVCDVLFELLLIAGIYNVDLDKEYPKVLEEIDSRRKEGEFDHI
jgi:NTP pyrophosphatase (non-canonical NTP hydrolase)